jgi:excisionase family DNA binding protein
MPAIVARRKRRDITWPRRNRKKNKPSSRPQKTESNENNLNQSDTVVITLEEAAVYLRVSADNLRKEVEKGGIPAQRIGDSWRFLKQALTDWLSFESWLKAKYQQSSEKPVASKPFVGPKKESVPSDQTATIPPDNKNPEPSTAEAVLRHAGVFAGDDDMEEFLADIYARRKAGTTA